jgi:hypothetical protein
MPKPKTRVSSKPSVPVPLDIEAFNNNDEPMEGPEPVKIDRRHLPRISYRTTAWLSPADDTGAVRRPIIRTRDLNPRCMGFLTRQDISALGEAILRLPTATSRGLAIACKVRRSLELGNGWFDCLVEFLQPQPDLAKRHAKMCVPSPQRSGTPRSRRI